jgi:Rap1a immunity proteins
MKTTRIALLAGLIILTQFNAVYASSFLTGNSLMEGWLAYKRIQQNRISNVDAMESARFFGYVTSIADVGVVNIPPTATVGQLIDIVGRYLDSHPEERHEVGAVLVIRALGSVFPLRK